MGWGLLISNISSSNQTYSEALQTLVLGRENASELYTK